MHSRNFDKNFVIMVIGQIVSILGSAVFRFTLNFYVLDITGRADIFATAMAISMIPAVICSPIGGAIADRFNRRNLMVIFDLGSGSIIIALILLFSAGHASIFVITIAMTLLAIISAMYQPTVQASVPILVKKPGLAQANGIVSSVGALSNLIGPITGGILYGAFGIRSLMTISCVAFFMSAVIIGLFLKIPFTKLEKTKNIVLTIFSDLKEGFRYITRENSLIFKTTLLAGALYMSLSAFFAVGAPYIMRIVMGSSETMYGLGMGFAQLAAIAGALSAGKIAPKMRLVTLYKWFFVMSALLLPMAFAVSPQMLSLGYWPAFLLFGVFAMTMLLMSSLISVFALTEVQQITPNEKLGKVMAVIMACCQCAMPLGQLIYGGLFQGFSGRAFVPVLVASVLVSGVAFGAKKVFQGKSEEIAALRGGD